MIKIIALISVAAFSTTTEASTLSLIEHAILDARMSSPEENLAYMRCYHLNGQDKVSCQENIDKAVLNFYPHDSEYSITYTNESEKLGFKHFLNENNRLCRGVSAKPVFIKEKQLYRVVCNKSKKYHFIRFDYIEKIWEVIDNPS